MFLWLHGLSVTKSMAKLHSIPLCLIDGGWKDIGYLSSLRIVKKEVEGDGTNGEWAVQHRLEGQVKTFPLSWLVDDHPILRLVLEKESEKSSCAA